MSGGVPTIPAPQFSTFATVVDPPTPLPSFLKTVSATHPDEAEQSTEAPVQTPISVPSPSQIRVPYPSAPTGPVGEILTKPKDALSKKLPLAPSASKNYKLKRTFKVIIVGDAGVGKTCLSFRFCCGRFPQHTEATIGVDFRERSCVIESELLRVQLWDTAGQERYRQSIVAHYYRNVNAVVFVYDVTCRDSFNSLNIWIRECEKHGLTADCEVPRILIGNKCDIPSENRVSTDEAQMFADRNNMALFETSAKAQSEADHVESIFLTLLHKLQQSKPMHVQSPDERQAKEQEKLVLKADEAARLEEDGCSNLRRSTTEGEDGTSRIERDPSWSGMIGRSCSTTKSPRLFNSSCSTPLIDGSRSRFDVGSTPADVHLQLDSKKRARKRTPPDRSLVTSTPGAVLQESLQVGRQMLGWDSNPSPQIEGRVASPLYQARTLVPQASAPHTAAGPSARVLAWVERRRLTPDCSLTRGAKTLRHPSTAFHGLLELLVTCHERVEAMGVDDVKLFLTLCQMPSSVRKSHIKIFDFFDNGRTATLSTC
ncbi:unnamed protein product [Caenorhabditis auriculariae]|uniref:Uncharacterized protein n=1 Tax=Caenorhabditis auriculariae TaxID=2777116 RepID=A0A8S1HNA2_9PELO|nr:unnamed protein product [Caenorhabditis auriculariae]